MDRERFDQLARLLAARGSRRGALGALLSVVLLGHDPDEGLAKPGKGKAKGHDKGERKGHDKGRGKGHDKAKGQGHTEGAKPEEAQTAERGTAPESDDTPGVQAEGQGGGGRGKRKGKSRGKGKDKGRNKRQARDGASQTQAEAATCCGTKSCPNPAPYTDRENCNYFDLDLSGTNAPGTNMRKVDGRETIFSTAAEPSNWSSVNFELACLQNTTWDGANLKSANFSRACLFGADLRGAIVNRSTNFYQAKFCNTWLADGSLSDRDCNKATACCAACGGDGDCGDGQVCCAGKCQDGNCCLTSGANAGTAVTCNPDQECCPNACFNTDTNPNNCGACGRRCPDGARKCCSGDCKECCDNADCPSGEECQNGTCVPTTCFGECQNSGDCPDVADCICCAGSCLTGECCSDVDCVNPEPVCNADNVCVPCNDANPCNDDEVCCGGSCFEGVCCNNDDCDAPGAPDCFDHRCVCPANENSPCGDGLTCCETGCENLQTDPDNCGSCGFDCPDNAICSGGACQCADGFKPCGELCIADELCCEGDNLEGCTGSDVCCVINDNGVCRECCDSDDCTNPAEPVCNSSGVCVACENDEQCEGDELCCSGSCLAVECCDSSDCTNPAEPICNSDNVCVPCANNGQCSTANKGDICCDGQCEDGNCCVAGDCADRQCETKTCPSFTCEYTDVVNGPGPLCNTICCSGICCGSDETCDENNQCECVPQCQGKVCGPNQCGGTCGDCPANSTCNGDGTACICDAGFKPCGEICIPNASCCTGTTEGCSEPTPNCCVDNTGNGVCRECCDSGQCTDPAEPICSSGVCVPCADNEDCSTAGKGDICCSGSCFDGICCEDDDCTSPGAPDCISNECVCDTNNDLPCSSGLTCCPSGCVDADTDPNNCGTCGFTCPPGELCDGGACECGTTGQSCGTGFTCCGGECVDTDTDPDNCGACGTACDPGETCSGGVCACPNSTCNGVCCPNAGACVFGECPCTVDTDCPSGEFCCGNGSCEECCTPGQCDPAICFENECLGCIPPQGLCGTSVCTEDPASDCCCNQAFKPTCDNSGPGGVRICRIKCKDDEDCPSGAECDDDVCKLTCTGPGTCPPGLECNSGLCEVVVCDDDDDCPAGQVCNEEDGTCVIESEETLAKVTSTRRRGRRRRSGRRR